MRFNLSHLSAADHSIWSLDEHVKGATMVKIRNEPGWVSGKTSLRGGRVPSQKRPVKWEAECRGRKATSSRASGSSSEAENEKRLVCLEAWRQA